MKLVIVSALFMAAMSLFAAPSSSAPAPTLTDDAAAAVASPAGSECVAAGGICRKSVCRAGEAPAPLSCGHDLGCCLPN